MYRIESSRIIKRFNDLRNFEIYIDRTLKLFIFVLTELIKIIITSLSAPIKCLAYRTYNKTMTRNHLRFSMRLIRTKHPELPRLCIVKRNSKAKIGKVSQAKSYSTNNASQLKLKEKFLYLKLN